MIASGRNAIHGLDNITRLSTEFRSDPYPRDEVVDLAAVYSQLVATGQLAGYEAKERFYEIGTHSGLNELDQPLRTQAL